MTTIFSEIINPDKPWLFMEDSAELILQDLERYTLDPIFEMYGDFVNPNPWWVNDELAAEYAGCTLITGNFLTYSHAFRVVTDDAELIARVSETVERNKARPEYIEALKREISDLPPLTADNAKPGQYYDFGDTWLKVTNVREISESEANEHALLYLKRFEGITREGKVISAALQGCKELPTTKNWKL